MGELDITKIGVFYDGNYFLKVSNYYNYEHHRKSRISIGGLHDFIKHQVAKNEGRNVKMCHVVDMHYFRGRLNAYDAREQNKLYHDRIFDDILMTEGVVTHYLPLKTRGGKREEKGIDVWLALEAYEMTIYKRFDVVVLIACDGDYVPLVRKLNTIGTRVMVLAWDFKYVDEKTGLVRETRTSQELLEEATYPIAMHEIIDNRISKSDPLITNLFVSQDFTQSYYNYPQPTEVANGKHKSTLVTVKNGYGFVHHPPNNLFFSYEDVVDGDFNELREGDWVEYTIGENERGEYARNIRKIRQQAFSPRENHVSFAPPQSIDDED